MPSPETELSVRRMGRLAWFVLTLPYQWWRWNRETNRIRRETAALWAEAALLKARINALKGGVSND